MTEDALKRFNAAHFAGGSYYRLVEAELSASELNEVLPTTPRERVRASRIAILALLADNSEASRSAIRDLYHGGESELSDEDLDRVAWLLESIAGSVASGQMLSRLRQTADEWAGIASKEERRCAVIECLSDAADPDATPTAAKDCLDDLANYDRRFAALDRNELLTLLRSISLEENAGGKRADGSARIGLHGAAARLSTSVGAFEDTNHRNAKAAFDQAWKKGEGRRLESQKEALAEIAKADAKRARLLNRKQ